MARSCSLYNDSPMDEKRVDANADADAEADSGTDSPSLDGLGKDDYNVSGDPVLARKMALINNAIDEIGITPFHWKLFFLNGLGYGVDSLLFACQSISQPAVSQEYGQPSAKIKGVAMASQVGMLAGAMIWGFSADIVGRKLAFNTSLFGIAAFALIAGAMPSYISFSTLVALYSACAAGNHILDATSFLEFLPTSRAWMVTFMSIWWPVGYTVAGLLAWALMSNYSCAPDAVVCPRADNMGWRYLHFASGGLVMLFAVCRVVFVTMVQTPKWLISQNRDEEAMRVLEDVARKYNRTFTLTLRKLQQQGTVLHTEKSAWSGPRIRQHFQGLFQTKKLAWSTITMMINWFVIGIVSPLYFSFLPYYLQSRGVNTSSGTDNYTLWRNYAINQIAGLSGPLIASVLVETRFVGRRGALAIGAAMTMVLQFGYTQITTPAQNLGVSAAITAVSNIYWATIYAYTPEILPDAHRATGYGLCVAVNPIGGIIGVLVGSYANVTTTAPIFVCAALFGLLIVLSLLLPFETKGRRVV